MDYLFLSKQRFQLGFSLLELLLVLLVLSILVLGSVGQYRRYQAQRDLEAVKHNVTFLKRVAVDFYHYQCKNNSVSFEKRFTPALFNLAQAKDIFPFKLEKSDLVYPQSNLQRYEIGAEPIASPIYLPEGTDRKNAKAVLYPFRLTLKIVFADKLSQEKIHIYKSLLGASRVENKKLIWEWLPGAPQQKTGDQLWIMEAALAQFKKKTTENFVLEREAQEPLKECAL